MSLQELAELEDLAVTTVLDVLRADVDLLAVVGARDIGATELLELVPEEYSDTCIQVKDPSLDFNAQEHRSKTAENPSILLDVYIYKLIYTSKPGATIVGTAAEKGLSFLTRLVLKTFLKEEARSYFASKGFYWVLPVNIVTSQPVPIADSDEDISLLACKTLVMELRKRITY